MYSVIKDILAFGTINILYFIYVEYNNTTKGIVFRVNSKNEKIFAWESIKAFAMFPLTRAGIPLMWYPINWDINYPLVMLSSFGIYKLFL